MCCFIHLTISCPTRLNLLPTAGDLVLAQLSPFITSHYSTFTAFYQTTGVYCLNSMTKLQITSPIQHFSVVHKTTRYLIWHELYYNKASRGIIVCIPHFPLVRQMTWYLVQTQHPTAFNPVEQEGHYQAPSSSQTSPQTWLLCIFLCCTHTSILISYPPHGLLLTFAANNVFGNHLHQATLTQFHNWLLPYCVLRWA